jgi:hypothetical protein
MASSSGVMSTYVVTLEVTGCKSGRIISLPVVAMVEGQRYAVSMLGEHVQWIQNVRAAGGRVVLHHGRREGSSRRGAHRPTRRDHQGVPPALK